MKTCAIPVEEFLRCPDKAAADRLLHKRLGAAGFDPKKPFRFVATRSGKQVFEQGWKKKS